MSAVEGLPAARPLIPEPPREYEPNSKCLDKSIIDIAFMAIGGAGIGVSALVIATKTIVLIPLACIGILGGAFLVVIGCFSLFAITIPRLREGWKHDEEVKALNESFSKDKDKDYKSLIALYKNNYDYLNQENKNIVSEKLCNHVADSYTTHGGLAEISKCKGFDEKVAQLVLKHEIAALRDQRLPLDQFLKRNPDFQEYAPDYVEFCKTHLNEEVQIGELPIILRFFMHSSKMSLFDLIDKYKPFCEYCDQNLKDKLTYRTLVHITVVSDLKMLKDKQITFDEICEKHKGFGRFIREIMDVEITMFHKDYAKVILEGYIRTHLDTILDEYYAASKTFSLTSNSRVDQQKTHSQFIDSYKNLLNEELRKELDDATLLGNRFNEKNHKYYHNRILLLLDGKSLIPPGLKKATTEDVAERLNFR